MRTTAKKGKKEHSIKKSKKGYPKKGRCGKKPDGTQSRPTRK